MTTKKDASLLVGVPLGALTALVSGGSVNHFIFGGHFFDPIILVIAFVLVPIVLIVGNRRSRRNQLSRTDEREAVDR